MLTSVTRRFASELTKPQKNSTKTPIKESLVNCCFKNRYMFKILHPLHFCHFCNASNTMKWKDGMKSIKKKTAQSMDESILISFLLQ